MAGLQDPWELDAPTARRYESMDDVMQAHRRLFRFRASLGVKGTYQTHGLYGERYWIDSWVKGLGEKSLRGYSIMYADERGIVRPILPGHRTLVAAQDVISALVAKYP